MNLTGCGAAAVVISEGGGRGSMCQGEKDGVCGIKTHLPLPPLPVLTTSYLSVKLKPRVSLSGDVLSLAPTGRDMSNDTQFYI